MRDDPAMVGILKETQRAEALAAARAFAVLLADAARPAAALR
jgi:hypothetical protein